MGASAFAAAGDWSTVPDVTASTRSIAVTRRPASERKLSCRMNSALRRARPARLSGQILPVRHDRALDQDRDDPHVAGKGGLDFQPDNVIWVIKPSAAPLVGGGQPVRADDRQQHLAGRHRAADFLGEVNARLDRVHIHEDLALAKTIGQAVSTTGQQDGWFLADGS